MKKILYIILDGLGDRPIKELNNLTPLEAAETPNMDFLAKKGITGMQNMLPEGVYPTSEECHLALFGYDYKKDHPGRGVLEALGAGIELGLSDIAFRINIGTVDENEVLVDPHAGGVESIKELTDSLQNIEIDGIKFEIYATLEHRGVLVLRSDEEMGLVSDTDPHKTGDHANGKILIPEALEAKGEKTAKALRKYQEKTYEILKDHLFNKKRIEEGRLPCNFVLTRGCGRKRNIENFEEKHGLNAAAVAGAPLYKGIARYLGMDLYEDPSFTGTVDTNLDGKVSKAVELLSHRKGPSKPVILATQGGQNLNSVRKNTDSGQARMTVDGGVISDLNNHSFVYLHIKGTDSLAEDFGDFKGKKEFIEKIDEAFKPLIELQDVIIMITGDHTTACEKKDHVLDPVPFLIYGGEKDNVLEFGETFCKEGNLKLVRGTKLLEIVIIYSKKLIAQN